ncbi:MAG: two-component system sensor histidine kinase/response regulator, partial [Candidatus Sumerlaeia bacterium]|nr:two-component system sensor histidine kinase/response regulator [Candidatus Sumerlaeia bacterium]
MFLDRMGYLEETFFTFSFSPIRDETGRVAGLFHPVTELTQETLARRRLRVLRDLAEHARDAQSLETAARLIGESLAGADLDLPFMLFYGLEEGGRRARLLAQTGVTSPELAPVTIDLEAAEATPWTIDRAARDGQVQRLDGLRERWGDTACGPYPEPPESA